MRTSGKVLMLSLGVLVSCLLSAAGLYEKAETERQERLEVVSDLVNDNINLRKHNEEMEKLLALVPVSVLKKIREEAKLG